MQPIYCRMCETYNLWHSFDANINYIETAFVNTILVQNESYTLFWDLLCRLSVISFTSKSVITSQFPINCYLRYLCEKWCGPITFLHFRPAIDGILIISLCIGKYSGISSPFLIQFFLLDFHDVPQAMSNMSPMCTRYMPRVVLATGLDRHIRFRYGSEPNRSQIGGPGRL